MAARYKPGDIVIIPAAQTNLAKTDHRYGVIVSSSDNNDIERPADYIVAAIFGFSRSEHDVLIEGRYVTDYNLTKVSYIRVNRLYTLSETMIGQYQATLRRQHLLQVCNGIRKILAA